MTSRKICTNDKRTAEAGFSLIEVIIVLALLTIVAGFAMAFSTSMLVRATAVDERELLVALLTEARARALANVDESAHGVYIDPLARTYTVYERRGSCTRATTSASIVSVPSDAIFAGSLDRCFNPLSVRVPTTHSGTTTLTLGEVNTTVNVNTVGRIDW